MDDQAASTRAFEFDGNWREFAPIAFTNLLLSIVTLGIYTFWARARERRYLWSHSRFIDDRLEWVGTGGEMFIGYLIAVVLFGIPLGLLQFFVQALAMRGHEGAAGLILVLVYLSVFYLVGLAVFRALRYRLSRTYWHGIRGGSDAQGFRYALSHFWRTMLGSLAAGLMVPWAMTRLWNRRWNAMSFGPHAFEANARWEPIMGRYMLFYLSPIIFFVVAAIVAAVFASQISGSRTDAMQALIAVLVIAYFLFFIVLGVVAIFFYSAYFREAVGNLSLADLDFRFEARSKDWIKLFVGNIALTVVTLGIGAIFIGYRNWAFFIRHMDAVGTLDLDSFSQSTTRTPGQGEGLLDAFDVGAI